MSARVRILTDFISGGLSIRAGIGIPVPMRMSILYYIYLVCVAHSLNAQIITDALTRARI